MTFDCRGMWTGPVSGSSLRALFSGGERTAPRKMRTAAEEFALRILHPLYRLQMEHDERSIRPEPGRILDGRIYGDACMVQTRLGLAAPSIADRIARIDQREHQRRALATDATEAGITGGIYR